MISFPNAKINLGLNILRKREDGFHEIDSVFYPVKGLQDVLEIVEAEFFEFTSTGLPILGNEESNLCVKAYQLLKKDYDLPAVKMHLHKVIPMGAGLGGGSADGAFVINMLDSFFNLNLTIFEKEKYAAQLGSDCAFFIKNIPAQATGRGEILNDINLNLAELYLVLVNPDIHIGTKEAYAGVCPGIPKLSVSEIIYSEISSWKNTLVNDFEKSVFPNYPQIEVLKNDLYQKGAIYASMTGSGSTVLGLFNKLPELDWVQPSYFVWTGKL